MTRTWWWSAGVLLGAALWAAPAQAQCTKDTDCKGDRVCEGGRCVNPGAPAAPAPPPDAGEARAPEAGPPEAAAPDAGPAPSPAPAAPPPPSTPAVSPADSGLERESLLTVEVRLDGFYGFDPTVSAGALMAGAHAGGTSWFQGSPWALQYLGGVEVGGMLTSTGVIVPAALSLELGGGYLFSGSHRAGTLVTLSWAPRLLLSSAGGELLSPFGAELALRVARLRVPLWFLRTTDQATFLGLGLGYGF